MSPDRFLVRLDTSTIVLLRPSPKLAAQTVLPCETESSVVVRLCRMRDDPGAFAQLHHIQVELIPGASVPASFDEMAEHVGAAVSKGLVQAYHVRDIVADRVNGVSAKLLPVAYKVDDRAVAFVDDNGKPVFNAAGGPMQRPAGLDPHFFVDQGLSDKQDEFEMLKQGAGTGVLGYEAGQLSKFKQGGPWDAQRVGGRYRAEFVDYATVIIGLYADASGSTLNEILTIQNTYAALFSRYSKDTLMDTTYTHLPARNVANTKLGYALYDTGRIRPTAKP